MNILFMGSPDFCATFLDRIIRDEKVSGIVTRPDKPKGRGHGTQPSRLKIYGREHGIPVLQPARVGDGDFVREIKKLKPDIILVIAFGQILPRNVLDIPLKGCMNIHFSLLPEYRGPAPVRRVLLNGEKLTGVTSILMDEGIDTGKIILKKEVPVREDDDYACLLARLVETGCDVLVESLKSLKSKNFRPQSQDLSKKCEYAPFIRREDARIDWKRPSRVIYNQIRALSPSPGTWTMRGGDRILKILKALPPEREPSSERDYKPGQIARVEKGRGFSVSCGDGDILVTLVQCEGKKICNAFDYVIGARLKAGDYIGNEN